jgi:hypothetical protein
MKRSPLLTALVLALVSVVAGLGQVAAQSPEPLCTNLGETSSSISDAADPLAGRLGGSRETFEARFGPPSEEGAFSISYDLEGCGQMSVSYEENVLTDVSFITPGYLEADALWSWAQAMGIAARLLPLDVEMREPFRNVSYVEHQPCYSTALANQVPMSVYEYVDNNPSPGQCSAVYEFDEAGEVLTFGVQLQIEDPN